MTWIRVVPWPRARWAGPLDDRTVGQLRQRNPKLDHVAPGADGSQSDVAAGGKIRIAAGDVGDKRGEFEKRSACLSGGWNP